MATGLELQSISKSFGANRVLEDVSLSVAPGEFVSLVGPSGCGKSTLLRIIAGLENQNKGEVRIGGAAVDHLGPRDRKIAMVFQSYALYPHMTAFGNIALPLSVGRLSLFERLPLLKHLSPRRRRIMRDISREVESVAGQLRIESLLGRKPSQLSGGQRQRVALARAIVRDPSVFLMDEPLSNLDAQLRVHMRDELADLHARLGATFVYVTHDQVEAMTMSSRVAMLDQGRLAQVGRPRELYEHPATLAVARFIGSPTINTFPATAAEGGLVELFGDRIGVASAAPAGSRLTVGLRPEALRPASTSDGDFKVRVRRIEDHGSDRLAFVDLLEPASGTAIVRMTGSESHAIGPGVVAGLIMDLSQLHLFDEPGRRLATKFVGTSALDGFSREIPAVVA